MYFTHQYVFTTLIIFNSIVEYYTVEDGSSVLFLTPYINSHQIYEARPLAKVQILNSVLESYSGFITVDEVNGVHIFFWFFPAVQNPLNAPVLLWFAGGPGQSAIFSIFYGPGPFSIKTDGNLTLRDATWTKTHSIIYIDQPVDVGYSFTEKEAGYAHLTSGASVAPNVYEFMLQFLKLFPELQKNHFYVSGVSYAGNYAPNLAHYIHNKNLQNPELRINLRGLILETPLIDPLHQVDYGDYLYQTGLIDEHALIHFKQQGALIQRLILEGRYLEAFEAKELLFDGNNVTFFANITGFSNFGNILKDKRDPSYFRLAEQMFRKYIHVGQLNFTGVSQKVMQLFKPNIFRSAKPMLEDLLNWGYKTLIYTGQLDIITYHTGVYKATKNLNWNGAEEFLTTTRTVWKVNDTVAGYKKVANNLMYVLIRNAGHSASSVQPEWVLDLINTFTNTTPFNEKRQEIPGRHPALSF